MKVDNSTTKGPASRKKKAQGSGMLEAKIVLLGDSGVGKSSIAQRFCMDKFDDLHDVTIGGAYMQKIISIPTPDGAGETQVKLHIWDTGGHEKFRSMISLYYRDAVGAIICYDLTDERTFESTQYWINEMLKNTTHDQGGFVMAMAGNKCDMPAHAIRVTAKVSQEVA